MKKNKTQWIGVRNLLIISAVLFALLFAVDKLLPVFSLLKEPEVYYGDADFMRLEKTPAERFLTVAEAKELCRAHNVDISGYNVSEYPLIDDMPSTQPKDDDTVHIVVIGDSFVWGDNSLNRNELFWRQAERLLREKGYNCSVTAIAMAAATAYEEIAWYENYLKQNTPDLAVFGYVYNDPVMPGAEAAAENAAYSDIHPALKPVELLLPHIYEGISSYIDAKTMYLGKYDALMPERMTFVLKGDVREYYEKNFAYRLDAITKETGIPSVVLTLPVIPRSRVFRQLFAPLQEIYAGTSVTFYDSYPAFDRFYSGKHKKNLFVNPGNNHPGSAVHYFYARFLVSALERDFGEVLGAKQSGGARSGVIAINECTPCGIGLTPISQGETQARYTLSYPEATARTYLFSGIERYRLTYPLGKGYVKLSFEDPVDLSRVELSGAPEGKTELYYTKVNAKLGYDDNTLYPVQLSGNGPALLGTINDEKITSLCIHIDEDASFPVKLGLVIDA